MTQTEESKYKCDKCRQQFYENFNRPNFVLTKEGHETHLCKCCYENFWKLFTEFEQQFREQWIKS